MTIKDGSRVERGCLIGDGVVIGPDARLQPFDRLSRRLQDVDEDGDEERDESETEGESEENEDDEDEDDEEEDDGSDEKEVDSDYEEVEASRLFLELATL